MNRLDLGDYEPKEMPGVGVPRVTSVSAELTKITLDTTVNNKISLPGPDQDHRTIITRNSSAPEASIPDPSEDIIETDSFHYIPIANTITRSRAGQ